MVFSTSKFQVPWRPQLGLHPSSQAKKRDNIRNQEETWPWLHREQGQLASEQEVLGLTGQREKHASLHLAQDHSGQWGHFWMLLDRPTGIVKGGNVSSAWGLVVDLSDSDSTTVVCVSVFQVRPFFFLPSLRPTSITLTGSSQRFMTVALLSDCPTHCPFS
ncbi:hypothetical protein DPEC_G00019180 [Dallia pectoralis]|uniref:Uncharacterized protein n=1 Tax=Dallia pectoralis TaxID=75939 RepID=A0ACC2HFI5_DALPE|nr:hypothetical protein DPEC_G00019180 [Dallia pectoralis]